MYQNHVLCLVIQVTGRIDPWMIVSHMNMETNPSFDDKRKHNNEASYSMIHKNHINDAHVFERNPTERLEPYQWRHISYHAQKHVFGKMRT